MATASSGGGTAVAEARKPTVKSVLSQGLAQIATVVGDDKAAAKRVQLANLLVYQTKNLDQCDPNTVLAAVMRAGSLGLDLDPSSNESFLIPRYDKGTGRHHCHFQIGYRGLLKLVRRSGELLSIRTALVCERDDFDHYYDPRPRLFHRPAQGKRGPVVQVYSHATLRGGLDHFEVMDRDEIEACRRRGQSGSGPWQTDWNEMARKTVLRRHCKSLPRSIDVDLALHADGEFYDGLPRTVISAPPGTPARGIAALEARLGAPEPTFSASQGVARPLRSEAEDDDYPAEPPGDDEAPRMRDPGED